MSAQGPKKFKELSESDQQFVRSLQMSGERAPTEWMQLFATLSAFDEAGDGKRTRISYVALIFALGTIAVLIHGKVWGSGFFSPLLAVPAVPFLLLAIWWFVAMEADIPDQLRNFIFPVVCRLNKDWASGHAMRLDINLQDFFQSDNMTTERRPYEFYQEVKTWSHAWFSGAMPLHDGATLTWSVSDEVTGYYRKRTSSDERHQNKFETRREFLVSIQRQADRLSAVARRGDALDPEIVHKRLETTSNGLPEVPDVDQLLSLVADAHREAALLSVNR